MMLTQKLYKNGNSVAVTIPKEFLRNLNLKVGLEVEVDHDVESQTIIISPKFHKKTNSTITPKFLTWLESFGEKYKDALTRLAKE